MTDLQLIQEAIKARAHAHAPYSNHRVGAVIVTKEGRIFSGVNVENCALPLGDCAERVAICKAVSEGFKNFSKLVIVTGNKDISPPCGGCRQIIREFCSENFEIILSNPDKKFKLFKLKDLLPFSFGPDSMHKGQD